MHIMQIRLGLVLPLSLVLSACGSGIPSPQTSGPALEISPKLLTMDQGEVQQFSASRAGVPVEVTWSVFNRGGTVDEKGRFTAPATAGNFQVIATSIAPPVQIAFATITVRDVTVVVSPTTADIEPGTTQQFTAEVTGTVKREVDWTLQEGSSAGSITNTGLYTAPQVGGSFHVLAATVANPDKSAKAAVTVSKLAVVIDPRAVGVMRAQLRQFSATVAGCSDDRVTWSVLEPEGGTIDSAGLYRAPDALGDFHVVATSVAHTTISELATISVTNSGFSDVADMFEARTSHTATLLPNGEVLVAGGSIVNGSGYSDDPPTAEIFHPGSNSFEKVIGKMTTGRDGHTATLLPSGKVLLAGGSLFEGAFALNSAEIYDPATGLFTATGAMKAKRAYHTATLLKSGKVLIAGGSDGWWDETANPGDVMTAEIYDEATGTFSTAGRMSSVRLKHTAAMLPDGRVLIAGGSADWEEIGTNSAEIFNPETGMFAPAGTFVGSRQSHTATLVNAGTVLLAGGHWMAESSDGMDYVENVYDDAYSFNVETGQFAYVERMIQPRAGHTATLLNNGQVLLTGGDEARYQAQSSAELFDSKTSLFVPTGSMRVARAGHAATLLNDGRVLITGGNTKSAEIFSLAP